MKAKRKVWSHETAAARLLAERGGESTAGELYNRISLTVGLRVADAAHAAHRAGVEASPASVAACLLGILLEVRPCPGQRSTDAPIARIGAHFGLGEKTTRIAIEVLEKAGVIAIQRMRGRRLRIVLCDGIDPAISDGNFATPEPAKPWKVRRRATALYETKPELCDAKCGGTPPQSGESAVVRHRTVRWHATALDEDLKRPEVTTRESVEDESRLPLAASLDERSEIDQTRARTRDPGDPHTVDAAPPGDPIDDFEQLGKPTTDDGFDETEPDPELRRGGEENRSPGDDDRIILRVREQETLQRLGIADYVIRGSIDAGITSHEILPVIAASEVRRERWLRAAEIGRWIRTTARERGHPIVDPVVTPPAPTKKPRVHA